MIGPIHAREYWVRRSCNKVASQVYQHPMQEESGARQIVKGIANCRLRRTSEQLARDYFWLAVAAMNLHLEYEKRAREIDDSNRLPATAKPSPTEQDEAFDEWLTRIPGATE